MTSINLTRTDIVEASPSAGAAVETSLDPTISSYAVWYKTGTVEWTAQPSDIISVNGFVSAIISGITCSGTDRAGVFVRSILYNLDTTFEVWASNQTQLVWQRIGTVEYGSVAIQAAIYDRLWAGPAGLLIPGTSYQWAIEVMKEQVVNTPTFTVTIDDSSAFSDAALLNL